MTEETQTSERIRVVLIREHDEPQHPVPFYDVKLGVVEGVPV